jgi:hypothetical protein
MAYVVVIPSNRLCENSIGALRRRSEPVLSPSKERTAKCAISNEAIPFLVSQPVLSEVEGNHERTFHTVWQSEESFSILGVLVD